MSFSLSIPTMLIVILEDTKVEYTLSCQQVGSFEVSTHSSDVSCPEQQQHLVQYSVYTNSTTDTTHISKDHVFSHMIGRSKVPDTPVSLVMRAPANSPQTFATDYSGFTTSSGYIYIQTCLVCS